MRTNATSLRAKNIIVEVTAVVANPKPSLIRGLEVVDIAGGV